MKFRLMDLLACPMCKKFPLKLVAFNFEERDKPQSLPSKCSLYCAFKNRWLKDEITPDCECLECFSREVTEGLLICEECYRWYPIIEEIPHMLPDDLRVMDPDEELEFMKKWKDRFPSEVLEKGRPFNKNHMNKKQG